MFIKQNPQYKKYVNDNIITNTFNNLLTKFIGESFIIKSFNDERIDKFRNEIIYLFQNNKFLTKTQIFDHVKNKFNETLPLNIYATITSELANKTNDGWEPKNGN
jgi:ABC-type ATPase involved in cell division